MAIFIKREYDYALRIAAYLAGTHGTFIACTQVSRELNITRPFCTKILFQLKNNGIVTTLQGKSGGAQLSRMPKDISFFDVLDGVGFDPSLVECLRIPGHCPEEGFCKIHTFFIEKQDELVEELKQAKLSDFIITVTK